MEFFDLFGVMEAVIGLFVPDVDDLAIFAQFQLRVLWISLIAAFAVYLLFVILGGIGLSTMAKKERKGRRWMAFVPILNTWYAGYVAGEARFFGKKVKRAGLYAMLFEIAVVLFGILAVFSEALTCLYPAAENFTAPSGEVYQTLVADVANMPVAFRWMFEGEVWITVAQLVADAGFLLFLCILFLALFRKYYARNPGLFTFLAVISLRGPLLFAVRKNTPVDYDMYLRKRFERRFQGYPGQGGPYAGGPQEPSQTPRPEEPFSDFGGDDRTPPAPPTPPDDPFSDF